MKILLRLVGVIALLLFLPLLFLELAVSVWYKHDVVQELQFLANESLESEITFDNIEVSALRHFPELTISVLGLSIKEDKYEVLYSDRMGMQINLLDIYDNNYALSKIEIIRPRFLAPVDSTGQKFMIRVKKKTSPSTGLRLMLDVPAIEIRDALIIINNEYKGNRIRMNIEKGDFRLRSFDDLLEFKGDAFGVLDTMISKGRLSQTAVPIAAHQSTLRLNTLDSRILFDGTLQLYNAHLKAYGLLKPIGYGNMLDITLEGDEARVNEYVALIPQFQTLNFHQHNPDARLQLTIHNSGYVDPVTFPNIDILFEMKDASFSRAGLPGIVDSVNFRGHFSNGKLRNAKTSEMVIDFGRAKVDNSFFAIQGYIRNFDDPYIDMKASSEIELEDVNELLDFPDLEMAGSIRIHADVKGRMSELEKMRQTKEPHFNGEIIFENVWLLKKPSNIKIEQLHGKVVVKNTELSMQNLHARYNQAKINISGHTPNFMPLVEQKSGRKSHAQLSIILDNLALTEADLVMDKKEDKEEASNLAAFQFPDFLNLNCNIIFNQFAYEDYRAESIDIGLSLTSDSMLLHKGHVKFDQGDFWLEGVSRPSTTEAKNYEIWLKADLDHINTNNYWQPKTAVNKKESSTLPDYAAFTVHTDLKFKSLTHDKITLQDIHIVSDMQDQNIHTRTLDFSFPYGQVQSRFDMLLIDSVYHLEGKSTVALTAIDIDSIKQYYNTIKPQVQKEDSTSKESTFIIDGYTFELTAPQVNYKDIVADQLAIQLQLNENHIRLDHAAFELFEGQINLSGIIKQDKYSEVKAFCNIDAKHIDLGSLTNQFGGPNKELFSKKHFKGEVGVGGQVLLQFNHKLEHQEDEMLGKIKVSLSNGELMEFPPITESLKFIKQANRDTILLANRNLEVLFHNDEVLLPRTVFKTSLSNIEFSGYHNKDIGFGFDLQVSVGDLLFKSQKKKRKQVRENKQATFGAIKHYLQARSENGKMHIQSMKKKEYREDLERLNHRYAHVDSTLKMMNLQIAQ
ncbi:AsmA-like C-terminal region-containing protein [Reichenbachiella carrageenanivorans]|uniref:AsmA-like C-terminal region-containing protein n=1 Tax=Reichenbachiella carrageenanivorans TaxID=2979869 RepID=A0ABY6D2J3_9BACT|nr:AsmA-like C-terminal region-containing protein [Reichenbachiella carrageenanivorans]UXX80377.1 AsmA-like C-terminal region-containing protein [Reichenbachiella carrageenanivorans]